MDIGKRRKYQKFIMAYISNRKICLNGMMKKHGYDEKFFEDAKNDNILKEIEKNKDGDRQFTFTNYAKTFLD